MSNLILDDLVEMGYTITPEAWEKMEPSDHSILINIHDCRPLFDALNRVGNANSLEECVRKVISDDNSNSDTDSI